MADDPAYIGELEQLVLLAILQCGDDAYTVSIRQVLTERSQRRAGPRGTLHVARAPRSQAARQLQAWRAARDPRRPRPPILHRHRGRTRRAPPCPPRLREPLARPRRPAGKTVKAPRLASHLARWAASGLPWGETACGDLAEEHALVAARRGRAAAAAWFWGQTALLLASAGRHRAAGAVAAGRTFLSLGDRPMTTFAKEVRIAVRALRHYPLITAAIVLTLALGLGVNAAAFSMLDALVFRPFSLPEVDRLAVVSEWSEDNSSPHDAGRVGRARRTSSTGTSSRARSKRWPRSPGGRSIFPAATSPSASWDSGSQQTSSGCSRSRQRKAGSSRQPTRKDRGSS